MTTVSNLAQSLSLVRRIETQQSSLDTLASQLATGKKTQTFRDLGVDGIVSKRARAKISSLDTYISNITKADRRIQQIDLTVKEFQNQTEILIDSLALAPQEGDYADFETIQALAKNVFNFLVDLVNEEDSDRFLFAGGDGSTSPLTDNGLLESFLGDFLPDETDLTNPPLTSSGAFGQWGSGTITTEEFIAAYRGIDDTTLGYSSTLSSGTAGKVFARVDDDKELDYTLLGNAEGFREIIIAVGVLKDMPPPEYAPGALNDATATTFPDDEPPFPPTEKQENFYQVINDLAKMMVDGVDKLNDERFQLAQVQVQMSKIEESYIFEKKTFADVVSEVEDVDITEVATRINLATIQLEASFSVTAAISQLTLVNFF